MYMIYNTSHKVEQYQLTITNKGNDMSQERIKVNLSTNETIELCDQVATAITSTLNATGRYSLNNDTVFSSLFENDFAGTLNEYFLNAHGDDNAE